MKLLLGIKIKWNLNLEMYFFNDQLCSFLNINPEDALERTNKKFIKRFQYLESKAQELGKPLMEMTLAEMDVFWEEAKKI